MQARYLMIAFDVEKPKEPFYALWKYIPKADYEILKLDLKVTVDIGEEQFSIVERRSFDQDSTLTQTTRIIIIDIKKVNQNANITSNERLSHQRV